MTPPRTRRSGTRGAVGPLIALALPVLLGSAALAIDLGAAHVASRRMQGIADAAAIAAAIDPAHAERAAARAVADAGWRDPIAITATPGAYRRDPAIAPDARFVKGAGATAVRVALQGSAPTYFAAIFGTRSVAIARQATAMRVHDASFSIGSRLVSFDAGLLNAMLGATLGSTVSLTVMDYQSLAGADIDVLRFLDALRSTASLDAATYDDLLAVQVSRSQLLSAIGVAAGPGRVAELTRSLAEGASGGTTALAGLFDLGPVGDLDRGEAGLVRVNALTLLGEVLRHGTTQRQIDLDLGSGIAGLADTRVRVAIGQRPANSPWIAITDLGTPIVRTAQARVLATASVPGVAIPGIGTALKLSLPLYVELASAEARLTGIGCATRATRSVTIEARPGPGRVAIAAIDAARFADFGTSPTLGKTTLIDTLLVDVEGRSVIDLGAAEAWRTLAFDNAAIAAGSVRQVASTRLVGGVSTSLLRSLSIDVRAAGLISVPAGPVATAVGAALTPVSPALDRLLATLTGALGVGIGEADVRVTGLRCGRALLVA